MSGADNPAGRLKQRLAALPDRVRATANAALRQAGDDAVAEVRRVLGTAEGAQPSVPGRPPRDLAGHIATSLAVTLDEVESVVTVAAASPQARFLEYGTRTMAARPFLRPCVEAVRPGALDAMRAALAAAARNDGESTP